PATFLFYRGDYEQPKQSVAPRPLTVLSPATSVEILTNDASLPSSGRRLAYARWLVSGEHPLVARVVVNRIWLHHFGRGLAPTPGDFGALGVAPTHPELLDWLASEFVAHGWSVKWLHKLLMTSTVYRQVSLHHAAGDSVDADNTLYWRMPVRRLEAEILRDAALAVSGELNEKAFGPPVPVMADRVGQFVIGKENLDAGRPGAAIAMNGEELRRSVYIQARRSRPLSVLAPFDLPRMEPNCTSRSASTVSPQSLMLMNSDFAVQRAKSFAQRIRRDAGEDIAAQIRLAWQWAYGAAADDEELAGAQLFLAELTKTFEANPDAKDEDPSLAALCGFCHALLSSNRFLYVD
ncbi:MAG: DUF1553 domain-containing protein, partial [Planctomycetales bacterium]|nr:DUF1553 domain-containing protein [Planctomycetales bacterium]